MNEKLFLTDNSPKDIKYKLLEPINQEEAEVVIEKTGVGISNYLNEVYLYSLTLIAVVAVFFIIYGGILYATTDIATKQKQGKETINRVILGIVFVFTAWFMLNAINPNLVKNSLKLFSLDAQNTSSRSSFTGAGATGDIPKPKDEATTPKGTPKNTPSWTNRCKEIPSSELQNINGYPVLKNTALAFNAMKESALKDGINLVVTSGYRTPQRQLEIWNSNGCKLVSGKPRCPGNKNVAIPCALGGFGSNHSSGHAIDINVGCSNGQRNCDTQIYRWLKRNGGKYGFYNNLPNDPLHWSATGY